MLIYKCSCNKEFFSNFLSVILKLFDALQPVKTAEEQAEAVRRRYRLLRERRGEFAAPDPDSVRVEDFQPIHYDVERIRQEISERQNNPFWNPNAKT